MFAPSAPALHSIVEAVLVLAVGVKAWLDKRAGPRRSLELDVMLTAKLAPVHTQLSELNAHVIGPDGENGIRGDVREIKKRLDGLEERERERLARQAYDRRST